MRITGGGLDPFVVALLGQRLQPRRASRRLVRNGDGDILDDCLALWFPAPRSFTGEDVLELHLHGGRAVVEGVCSTLLALGLRAANAGEFTRRAFQNGKLDLVQAEAVADLVDAETEGQRRQALANLGGKLSTQGDRWRDQLIGVLARLEAQVDFPDEDIPPEALQEGVDGLRALEAAFRAAAEDRSGLIVRDGFHVVIIGPPNAGKSSLLNALTGRDAAIVTPVAGTTRDVVTSEARIGSVRLSLSDTAGLRSTVDVVEALGVARAREAARAADLRLFVAPVEALVGGPLEGLELCGTDDVLVVSKSDLAQASSEIVEQWSGRFKTVVSVTVSNAAGVSGLRGELERRCAQALVGGEATVVFRERHRRSLRDAAEHLARASDAATAAPELAAEDVRLALRELERLVGKVGAEGVLDVVFSAFCIGK